MSIEQELPELPALPESPSVASTELNGRYVTVEQEALRTGKSTATVKRWCSKKYDPANPRLQRVARVGRQWLIRVGK